MPSVTQCRRNVILFENISAPFGVLLFRNLGILFLNRTVVILYKPIYILMSLLTQSIMFQVIQNRM